MPYTVATSFEVFKDNISLSGDHKGTAESRTTRLVSLLGNTFTILDAFPTGSIPKDTALKGCADLDIMVVLHWAKHVKSKTPTQLLQDVRDALGEYRTNVRKNGQAVTLYYDSWPDVDVVPVSRVVNDDNSVNYYSVPDTVSGGWLISRPRKHANAINAKANECGFRFKPIVRMIKQWNMEHSDLMSSYHIEVLALNIMTGQLSDYPWSVFTFFEGAVKLGSAPLAHEGGFADDYLDWAKRIEVVKRLETARDRARDAWHLTFGGRAGDKEAIEIWRQVFGSKFPTYG